MKDTKNIIVAKNPNYTELKRTSDEICKNTKGMSRPKLMYSLTLKKAITFKEYFSKVKEVTNEIIGFPNTPIKKIKEINLYYDSYDGMYSLSTNDEDDCFIEIYSICSEDKRKKFNKSYLQMSSKIFKLFKKQN